MYPFCDLFQFYFLILAVGPFTMGEAAGRDLMREASEGCLPFCLFYNFFLGVSSYLF